MGKRRNRLTRFVRFVFYPHKAKVESCIVKSGSEFILVVLSAFLLQLTDQPLCDSDSCNSGAAEKLMDTLAEICTMF